MEKMEEGRGWMGSEENGVMMMSGDEEGDEEEYWFEDSEHVNIIIKE